MDICYVYTLGLSSDISQKGTYSNSCGFLNYSINFEVLLLHFLKFLFFSDT